MDLALLLSLNNQNDYLFSYILNSPKLSPFALNFATLEVVKTKRYSIAKCLLNDIRVNLFAFDFALFKYFYPNDFNSTMFLEYDFNINALKINISTQMNSIDQKDFEHENLENLFLEKIQPIFALSYLKYKNVNKYTVNCTVDNSIIQISFNEVFSIEKFISSFKLTFINLAKKNTFKRDLIINIEKLTLSRNKDCMKLCQNLFLSIIFNGNTLVGYCYEKMCQNENVSKELVKCLLNNLSTILKNLSSASIGEESTRNFTCIFDKAISYSKKHFKSTFYRSSIFDRNNLLELIDLIEEEKNENLQSLISFCCEYTLTSLDNYPFDKFFFTNAFFNSFFWDKFIKFLIEKDNLNNFHTFLERFPEAFVYKYFLEVTVELKSVSVLRFLLNPIEFKEANNILNIYNALKLAKSLKHEVCEKILQMRIDVLKNNVREFSLSK
ncbi:hypothetical protein BN1013_02129 [Candidatus Rubidus massiliensis]|nr:hypothetical protein BN1013_02129 [Candidatus Rubidus massiliensis]